MGNRKVLIVAVACLTLITFGIVKYIDIKFENFEKNQNSSLASNVSLSHKKTMPDNFRYAAKKSMAGVVYISTREEVAPTMWDLHFGRSTRVYEGTGSGVLYTSTGFIITNNHVIDGATEITVTLNDSRKFKAELIGSYPPADLAVLKINANNLPSLNFSNSDLAEVGDWVLAVGNPYSLSSTVTAGIISAKGRNINIINSRNAIESFIQTDAAINPGNSGGALVDLNAEVVGINTAIFSKSNGYSGYGFAIPANLVSRIAEDIIKTGTFKQVVLGIEASELDDEYAKYLNLSINKGLVIERVSPGGLAHSSGIKEGDVIFKIDQKKITSIASFREAISSKPRGSIAKVYIQRNNKEEIILLNL